MCVVLYAAVEISAGCYLSPEGIRRWQSININAAHPNVDQYTSIYGRHAVDIMNYGES